MSQSSQRAGRPPVLDDRWSAIMLRRAATNKPLPEDIDKRLDHEWLDGLTLAQSEGQGGIDRFVANFETRHGDDPELVRRVKAALAAALDDPGGDPGAEAPGSATERPAPPPFNLGLVKTGVLRRDVPARISGQGHRREGSALRLRRPAEVAQDIYPYRYDDISGLWDAVPRPLRRAPSTAGRPHLGRVRTR